MLDDYEISIIKDHGTAAEGLGLYYVEVPPGDKVQLTLRGIVFYQRALQHYGLNRPLAHTMTQAELMLLNQDLTRARTQQMLGDMHQTLNEKGIPAQQRDWAHAFLFGTPEDAQRAHEAYVRAREQGANVVPLTFPRTPDSEKHK